LQGKHTFSISELGKCKSSENAKGMLALQTGKHSWHSDTALARDSMNEKS
jgi:hypothetical protein